MASLASDDEFADLEDDEVDGGDLNASDKMSSLLAKG